MKEYLVILALALGLRPGAIDGDTVRFVGEHWRITGYDTPELFSPHCEWERRQALKAKWRLRELLKGARTIEFIPVACATHNYGRGCAQMRLNGRDVAFTMIEESLAIPFLCEGGSCPQRFKWCATFGDK